MIHLDSSDGELMDYKIGTEYAEADKLSFMI